jgi:hypothetical protein
MGGQRGVAAAVLDGLMAFVACLPRAALFVVAWLHLTRLSGHEPSLGKKAAYA